MKPFLSVIVPAYNEEHRLSRTIRELSSAIEKMRIAYEIILVDDGSSDTTLEIMKTLEKELPNVAVIGNERNMGKGHAVKKGMLAARGSWRLFMDADNSTPFSEFRKIEPLTNARGGIIIGSRHMTGSVVRIPQPWHRRLLGRAGNLFIRMLLLPGISDTHCGFKCMTEEAAEAIFPLTKVNRWAFDDEVLVLGKEMGYPIREVPVVWTNEDTYTTFKISDYAVAFRDAFWIKFRLLGKQYAV